VVDPSGSNASVTVAAANLTGVGVTMTDPVGTTLTAAPKLQGVSAFNTGALVQYGAITNNNGVELATSYTLQWSTSSTFATVTGSQTFKAIGSHGASVWFLNGLTNGSVYYFRLEGMLGTTASGVFSSTVGPVTIGAPTGGVTVSGAISYTGTATGPMYTGFYDQNTGNFYGEYIATPNAGSQAYTVQVPIGSNYVFVGVIDQNKDGVLDWGDLQNVNSNVVTVITGATTGENLTLPTGDSTVQESTQHMRQTQSGTTTDTYSVNLQTNGLLKLPMTFTVVSASNPNVIVPSDVGLAQGSGSLQFSPSLYTDVPAVGDTYGITVTNSDGTTDNLTATVSLVPSFFATNLAPVTGGSVSTTPTFTWSYPASASSYTYQFYMGGPTGTVWQIQGNYNNGNGFPSTISPSITWGTDPTGAGSTPSVPNLTLGTAYFWQIQASDSNGNSATQEVNYQP
jgi:hypothetical protein